MKIAFVTGWGVVPEQGGQGTFCAELAAGLAERGHAVSLLSRNVPSWRAWVERTKPPQPIAVTSPSAARLIEADVVHLNGPAVRALAVTSLLRRPTVVTHQGYHLCCPEGVAWSSEGCDAGIDRLGPCQGCRWRSRRSWLQLRVLARMARTAANIAVSDCVRRRLALDDTVLNPFDVTSVPDLSEVPVERRVAFIGRLVPEKGPQVAVAALPFLPGVQLDIYGEGVLRNPLEDQARTLGVVDRVRFVGSRPSPVAAAASAAAILVPGLWDEPLGYVTIEAMAAGKAVVVTALGGSLELLNNERGWLVRPDDPRALADAVTDVLTNHADRIQRGRRARDFIRSALDPGRVAERYEGIYQHLMQRHASLG